MELDLSGSEILVIEDDALLRKRVTAILERLGAQVQAVDNLAEARQRLTSMSFDFAILDVNLPDGLGTELLRERDFRDDTAVIVVTAHGGVAGAVEAIRLGAADYLVKPFETEELPLVLERARRGRQSARIEAHRRNDRATAGFFFGAALQPLEAHLQKILAADQRLSDSLPPVLIQGETGTGKTALARWLHEHGPRAQGELIEVNCSALPEALAESELFGHERGAFTDARATRMGLFEAAQGGTLFLDELPSLSLPLQAKVLTAIEDRKIRRVGSNKSIPVDARIIAATQHDLKARAAAGLFREDLYHRLDLFRLVIPPLRERGHDIVKLTEWFAAKLARKYRLPERQISDHGQARLLAYHWPGNVRELAHEVERALVFEDDDKLNFTQLPGGFAIPSVSGRPSWLNPDFSFPEVGFSLDDAINRLVQLAMAQAKDNVSAAARLLGMPRDFVRYRLGQKNKKPGGN